jgi:hypothetical protein
MLGGFGKRGGQMIEFRWGCRQVSRGIVCSPEKGWPLMMAAENMTCREFVECVGPYYDGDLPAHHQSAFATHLAGCLTCRAYLGAYEATVRLAREALKTSDEQQSDLPEELVKSILKLRRRRK